ncbi:uncharacterized protein B0H18DRAFT_955040 [Fomitopsis serialis]|uniref:uncharacterized protein n=1 Tax=Fomitopsis serialis TaxID=139415 RepID=UPI00200796BD|nr:uncharacterized protein B0H18DRAFT_955040 [Neoantrodia serialis]KAH9925510.1 hypothetical protein B0H18DRAFT_955040 [Neoantrodia serialis]
MVRFAVPTGPLDRESGELPRWEGSRRGQPQLSRAEYKICTRGFCDAGKGHKNSYKYILGCYKRFCLQYMGTGGEGAQKSHCQRHQRQGEAGRGHAEAQWRESGQPPGDRKLAPWDRKSFGTKRADDGVNFGASPRENAQRSGGGPPDLRSQIWSPRPATGARCSVGRTRWLGHLFCGTRLDRSIHPNQAGLGTPSQIGVWSSTRTVHCPPKGPQSLRNGTVNLSEEAGRSGFQLDVK